MSKKKTGKPSFRFEVLKRKLNNETSNTEIEKKSLSSYDSHQKKDSKKIENLKE